MSSNGFIAKFAKVKRVSNAVYRYNARPRFQPTIARKQLSIFYIIIEIKHIEAWKSGEKFAFVSQSQTLRKEIESLRLNDIYGLLFGINASTVI